MKITSKYLAFKYCGLVVICFSMIGCPSSFTGKQAGTQIEKPNILFILLDDLGKEWVSSYGADSIETPNVDKLAKGGMQFMNAYSMPQCTPTRVTLLTGQYPWRHGWINHFDVPRWGHGCHFDSDLNPSFAKIMKEAGYVTAIAGKWQVDDFRVDPEVLVMHGFDEYCMWTGGEGGNPEVSGKRYWDPYIHTKEGSKTYKGQFGPDIYTDFLIDFMRRNKDKPMLVYFPMCLTHGPLTRTPEEPEAEGKMERHKAMVRYTDLLLGKIINALDEFNIRDRTIIIWTTDNGTSGSITGSIHGRKIKGGKAMLTESGINAPFIVNCPGLVPEGILTEALTDFTDMLPTFAELGDARLPEDYVFDGKSIAKFILGKEKDTPRDWIMALGSHPAAIRNGRVESLHKFRDRVIRDKQYKVYVDTLQKMVELYNLKNDPDELNNLIESNEPDIIMALEKFTKVIASQPEKDANPIYNKLPEQEWDIPPERMNSMAEGSRKAANKRR